MANGLKRGTVKLENYTPAWAKDFAAEKVALEKVYGDATVAIEHVGSTAIPGLIAKPIIDIEVGLKHFDDWRKFVKPLETIGYTFMPDRVKSDEIFMPKGPEERRTHYLHITEFNSHEWQKVIKFRDKLRLNSKLRCEYEELKMDLVKKYFDSRAAYSDAKTRFIMSVIGEER